MPVPARRLILLGLACAMLAPASASAAPKVRTIVIEKMAFGPAPSGLRVGDTIEWVNKDIFQHSATARDGGFNVDVLPNRRVRTVLRKAGVVQVYCRYHPTMKVALAVAR